MAKKKMKVAPRTNVLSNANPLGADECELRLAARQGDLKTVRKLIKNGVNPNAQLLTSPTAAEKKRWKEKGSERLESQAELGEDVDNDLDPNCKESASLGWTALHLACQFVHLPVVKFLLQNGADVNATNRFGETPLHSLFLNEDLDRHPTLDIKKMRGVLDLLVDANADLGAADLHQAIPFDLVAFHPRAKSLARILARSKSKRNPKCTRPSNDWKLGCLLRLHARNGDLKKVQALLKQGVDPNSQDDNSRPGNWKPLGSEQMEADDFFGPDVVNDLDPLICFHANLAWTALHLACQFGHVKVAQTLLESGADPMARNAGMETPLHSVFLSHDLDRAPTYTEADRLKLVKMLLKAGADANAKDLHQCTVLNLASWRKNAAESILLLLEAGAEVNTKCGQGSSPLHNAADVGAAETVAALLAAPGIKVNRKVEKRTAFQLAKTNGHSEICSLLVNAGANPA